MYATEDPDMKVRTARKRYPCLTAEKWDGTPTPRACTGHIERGQRYVEYLGETAAYASGHRYCESCCVAAGLLPA